MFTNVSFHKTKDFMHLLNDFLSVSDLDSLLYKICAEVPNIIGTNCSIFLIPELVPEYTGQLVRGAETTVSASELDKEFIVLARTTIEEFREEIGKIFYQKGYGLTGWIFEKGRPLRIKDMQNNNELKAIDENLKWADEYKNAEFRFSEKRRRMPFLGVPLMKGDTILGVIEVGDTLIGGSFSSHAQDILTSFARILSNLLENVQLIEKQKESIERLVKIGSTKNRQEVFDSIVQETSTLVGAENCELYTLDEFGEKIVLHASTGGYMEERNPKPYETGYGLTGWVFKTGKPLWLGNIQEFKKGKFLNDRDLKIVSDGKEINEEDRWIKWADVDKRYKKQHLTAYPSFLGVPIKSEIGEVLGVLRASAPMSKESFDKNDMYLLQDFANNISLILHNERQKQLNEVLIEVGNIYNKSKLFNYVVDQIPKLVLGRGCSVFLKQQGTNKLSLAYTNSPLLKRNGNIQRDVIDLLYEYGEGKTGFVANIGRPLLINYYGTGEIQKRKMQEDYRKYKKYSNNLVCYLSDEKGSHVGITRIFKSETEKKFTKKEGDKFHDFCKEELIYKEGGLPSHKKTICETGEQGYVPSFLAAPIKSKTGGLLGVIRIPRTSEGGKFSYNDLLLVESIVARLTSALEIETNLKILSDINSRINSYASKDEILERILEAVTDTLGFEFATIQLVDNEEDTIETVGGRKNSFIEDAIDPRGWAGLSHPLNPPEGKKRDIHAYVLMEEENPFIIKGWDDHFHKEIYNRFHHETLVRAFVPIIAYEPATGEPIKIGTLEVGHNIYRKDHIDDQELEVIKAVANQVAITIRNREQRSELISDASHQLRTFLTPVKSCIDNMLYETYGRINDKQRSRLKTALSSLEEEFRLIENLLGLARIAKEKASLEEEFQDISSTIMDVAQIFEYDVKEKNISLNCESLIERRTMLDRSKIKHVLTNLLENAIKFTPEGGHITVSTFEGEEYFGVKVHDTGIGIPEGERSKIFEEFYQGDSSSLGRVGGSGIGLSIAKNYVELHGGKIWVESEGDTGSTFIFTIPKVRETVGDGNENINY